MISPLVADLTLPNDLRRLLALNIFDLLPWYLFRQKETFAFASKAFANEDIKRRSVLTFASRQDCDDFAGLQIVDGRITSRVIYFHPVFGPASSAEAANNDRTHNICMGTYPDVFSFLSEVIVRDMRECAAREDATEIEFE